MRVVCFLYKNDLLYKESKKAYNASDIMGIKKKKRKRKGEGFVCF